MYRQFWSSLEAKDKHAMYPLSILPMQCKLNNMLVVNVHKLHMMKIISRLKLIKKLRDILESFIECVDNAPADGWAVIVWPWKWIGAESKAEIHILFIVQGLILFSTPRSEMVSGRHITVNQQLDTDFTNVRMWHCQYKFASGTFRQPWKCWFHQVTWPLWMIASTKCWKYECKNT